MARLFYPQDELSMKRDLLNHFRNELPTELQEGFEINTKALVGYFPSEHAVSTGIGGYSLHGPFVEGSGCETILIGVTRSELVSYCVTNIQLFK